MRRFLWCLFFLFMSVLKASGAAINEDQYSKRIKRQLTRVNTWRWPNGEIYYYFDTPVQQDKRQLFYDAMQYISSRTCVKFIEDATAINRLKIVNDGSCSSYIGMNTGEQDLKFPDYCMVFGTCIHELLHALGMDHIHTRYDRDDYLIVNLTAIGDNNNFNEHIYDEVYMPVPYEYGSCMHYSKDASASESLMPKQTEFAGTLGSRKFGTFYDIVNVNWHYNCKCQVELECQNGGYANPADCTRCNCPHGYGGKLCDAPPGSTTTLPAIATWQNHSLTYGTVDNQSKSFLVLYVRITAPTDKTIEVRITEMNNFACWSGCNANAVEVKYMGDPRITNPMHCCEESVGLVFRSKLNPTPVIFYQRFGQSSVTISYRYVDVPVNGTKGTNGYDCYEYYL